MYASFAPERLGASSPADGAHDSDAASSSAPTVHVPAQDAHAAFLIFAVAFVFNLNAALWTSQKHRIGLNVQVAYISAVAAWTHREMANGDDWYVSAEGLFPSSSSSASSSPSLLAAEEDEIFARSSFENSGAEFSGTSFSALRVLEWVFTTPVLLILVQHIHEYAFAASEYSPRGRDDANPRRARVEASNESASSATTRERGAAAKKATAHRSSHRSASAFRYRPVNKAALIIADEVMILCGVFLPLYPSWASLPRVALLLASVGSFCFVVSHSVRALLDVALHADLDVPDACRVWIIILLKTVAWSAYPCVFFAADLGRISVKTQHELYLYNDVLTKFSYTLVVSAGSLRFLDLLEEHRAAVAAQMSQVQRAFFFNITHELRTPLNSIIGFNTLAMESGELTEFTGSFIKASLTSAEALLGLINQILDFAKFEGAKDASGGALGSIELSRDEWRIAELVEQVSEMTQKASSRGVDFVVRVRTPAAFRKTFVGDFFRLRQCCVNLVDNAVKYSSDLQGREALVELIIAVEDEGEDEGVEDASAESVVGSDSEEAEPSDARPSRDEDSRVFSFSAEKKKKKKNPPKAGASARSSRVTFEVRDNGVGIPASKRSSLFVPFCQPAEHRAAKEKGTGLGLVITKSIVECMGGTVDFESEENEGARFFFTLDFDHPAAKTAPEAGGNDGSDRVPLLPLEHRFVFHPSARDPTRRHVGSLLRCHGAAPRRRYVGAANDADFAAKMRRAASGGGRAVAVAEAPREGDKEEVLHFALAILDHLRALTREGGLAGAVVVGRPYQLIELRKRFGDRENLRMILAPVKPSDFLDAARRLARAKGAGGEGAGWGEGAGGEGGEADADGIDAAHRAALVAEREAEPGWMFDSVSSAGGEPQRDEGSGSGSGSSRGGECENEKGPNPGGGSGSVATVHDSDLDLSGMRVLLVEDNALNQQMATFSIVKRGASLDVASHGGEAVDLVRKSFERRRASLEGDPRGSEAAPPPLPYDCVLMDMMMPVMDGAEATKRIRALETEFAVRGAAATRMPIVGLSANVGPEYTARVKAAGMDGTLSKPFYPATLRSTLASVKKGEYQGFAGTTIA